MYDIWYRLSFSRTRLRRTSTNSTHDDWRRPVVHDVIQTSWTCTPTSWFDVITIAHKHDFFGNNLRRHILSKDQAMVSGAFSRSRAVMARYDVSPHMVKWWKGVKPMDGQVDILPSLDVSWILWCYVKTYGASRSAAYVSLALSLPETKQPTPFVELISCSVPHIVLLLSIFFCDRLPVISPHSFKNPWVPGWKLSRRRWVYLVDRQDFFSSFFLCWVSTNSRMMLFLYIHCHETDDASSAILHNVSWRHFHLIIPCDPLVRVQGRGRRLWAQILRAEDKCVSPNAESIEIGTFLCSFSNYEYSRDCIIDALLRLWSL